MKRRQVLMAVTALVSAAVMMFTMTGCVKSVKASSYRTVNGVTEGDDQVSTDDNGSASFNVEGNHVEMTNFSFDADPALQVEAEIKDESMVYTQVFVHDNGEVKQNVADGHFREVFTRENAPEFLNEIYQTVFGGSDVPVTAENLGGDRGVLIIELQLSDGLLYLMAKEGTDQFAAIAVTTSEYGSLDIINAAFDTMKDESAPGAGEDPIDDGEAQEANADIPDDTEAGEAGADIPDNTEAAAGYPAYSHVTDNPYYAPICQYIMDTFGPYYQEYDIMLPYVDIFWEDDADPEDILVWGNYRLFNYAKRGTTLMTMNGGSHPGLIHLKEEDGGYVVTSMDEVKDGSDYDESVEEIFGGNDERLEAFWEAYENEMDIVEDTINWYMEDTGIEIEAFEDYGDDPYYLDPDADTEIEYPDLEGDWAADGVEMVIRNPEEGSNYDVSIWVKQDDGSELQFGIWGQYEASTGALYYWEGLVKEVSGDSEEVLGEGAVGYLGLQDENTIVWYNAQEDTEIVFERA